MSLHPTAAALRLFGPAVTVDDQQDSKHNVNCGKLPLEKQSPIKDWITVASFVDEDEIVSYPDTGLLWMFGKPAKK